MGDVEPGDEVEWPTILPSWQQDRMTGTVGEIKNGYAIVLHLVEVDGRLVESTTTVALSNCRLLRKATKR